MSKEIQEIQEIPEDEYDGSDIEEEERIFTKDEEQKFKEYQNLFKKVKDKFGAILTVTIDGDETDIKDKESIVDIRAPLNSSKTFISFKFKNGETKTFLLRETKLFKVIRKEVTIKEYIKIHNLDTSEGVVEINADAYDLDDSEEMAQKIISITYKEFNL